MVEKTTVLTGGGIVAGIISGQIIVSWHLRGTVSWFPYLFILTGGAVMGGITGMVIDDLS
jgi:hypothetical protein